MTKFSAYGRGVASALMSRAEGLWLRFRVAAQRALAIGGRYQPNPFQGRPVTEDQRACQERFEAAAAVLPPRGPLSCIDIGCNIGYFTFRMAERGGICLGLDIGRNEINLASGMAAVHDVRNAGFLRFEITPETVRGLPDVDVVICMSVFHHWVRKLGLEKATAIMDGVASKCRYLVFETGQHNETDTDWAEDLSFMGADCDHWIRQFLRELGAVKVTHAGQFPTTLSKVKRHLYVAEMRR